MTATRAPRVKNREGRMSLADHLRELRKRVMISAAAILVGAIGAAFLTNTVFDLIRDPILRAQENGLDANLNFTGIAQNFDLRVQIAVTIAIVIASPVWLWQIWAFLVPGLVRREKLYALGFLGTAVPLFLAGCYAGWAVMPHIVELMLGFISAEDAAFLDARTYYDFVLKLMLAIGVAFVLPVFLVLLNFVGVLEGKSILKGWRIAILAITLFCAMATPSADVVSMFVLATPMVGLYFAAVGITMVNDRRRQKRQAAELANPAVA